MYGPTVYEKELLKLFDRLFEAQKLHSDNMNKVVSILEMQSLIIAELKRRLDNFEAEPPE